MSSVNQDFRQSNSLVLVQNYYRSALKLNKMHDMSYPSTLSSTQIEKSGRLFQNIVVALFWKHLCYNLISSSCVLDIVSRPFGTSLSIFTGFLLKQ